MHRIAVAFPLLLSLKKKKRLLITYCNGVFSCVTCVTIFLRELGRVNSIVYLPTLQHKRFFLLLVFRSRSCGFLPLPFCSSLFYISLFLTCFSSTLT